MASTTPNIGLIVWSGSDQFSQSDLAANWNAIDTAVGGTLAKTGTDTLAGTVTVSGIIQFGSTGTIPFQQVSVTASPSNYKAVKVGGSMFVTKTASSDVAFATKLDADAVADASFRFKVKADGKLYWGNGTAQDIALYRDSAGSALLAQIGSDVDGSNNTIVVASVDKNKKFLGPALARTNYVWNPDFEADTGGWSVAGLSGVVAAATSITRTAIAGTSAPAGSYMGQIVTPGSTTNEGAIFPIYRRFQAGTQYTAKVKVYSAASTNNVQIGFGASGVVYASSSNQALSSTWTEITLTWTPISTVDMAYLFVRQPGTAAITFSIDEIRVYSGSTPTFGQLNFPVAENMPRWAVQVADITMASATQYIFAVPVEKGMTANRISLLAGDTTAVGITAAEGALYSVALDTTNPPGNKFNVTRLAQSPTLDYFTYNGPYAPITWDFATPYRFTYTGVAYIGAVITASGTMPTLSGRTTSVQMLYAQRAYHWYPLVAKLSGTGTPLGSTSTVSDLAAPGNATNDKLAYAWIS